MILSKRSKESEDESSDNSDYKKEKNKKMREKSISIVDSMPVGKFISHSRMPTTAASIFNFRLS